MMYLIYGTFKYKSDYFLICIREYFVRVKIETDVN